MSDFNRNYILLQEMVLDWNPWTPTLAREESLAGYNVHVVPEGVTPDFNPPTFSLGVASSASVPFSVGADGTRYVAAVRCRTDWKYISASATRLIRLVAKSGELVARPNSPSRLRSASLAVGDVELRWEHADLDAAIAASEFRIYGDGGTGELNTSTPLATVSDPRARRAVISGLAVGWSHLLLVRAWASNGEHDGGWDVVRATPRTAVPPGLGTGDLTLVQA